jgi:uncharacterized protein (DUF58 family)
MKWSLPKQWVLWSTTDNDVGGEVTLIWENWLPLPVLLVLIVLDLTMPARVWEMLFLAFLLLTAVAGFWAWEMARWVRVKRELPVAWVQAGDLLREHFSITNSSFLPALCVEIRDYSEIPGYSVSIVRTVGSGRTDDWISRGEVRLRGEYEMGPWEATTCDPFGLFRVVQRAIDTSTVLVYPPIAQQLPYPVPRGAASGRARISERSWSPTVTVGSVREYVAGDPVHHIHWPTTARRFELYTKEFDQESGGDIWLVLDLDRDVQVGSGERSTEEFGVIVAGSVAALLLDTGRAVGIITHGAQRQMVTPARGRGQLWNVLRALARSRANEPVPLSRVLDEMGRALPPGTGALVITPSSDPTWISSLLRLQGSGVGVAALLVDATAFSQSEPVGAGDVEPSVGPTNVADLGVRALRGLLADAQLEAEVIPVDMPLFLRPPTGKVRRWEFRIGGTGRAIAVSKPWGVE